MMIPSDYHDDPKLTLLTEQLYELQVPASVCLYVLLRKRGIKLGFLADFVGMPYPTLLDKLEVPGHRRPEVYSRMQLDLRTALGVDMIGIYQEVVFGGAGYDYDYPAVVAALYEANVEGAVVIYVLFKLYGQQKALQSKDDLAQSILEKHSAMRTGRLMDTLNARLGTHDGVTQDVVAVFGVDVAALYGKKKTLWPKRDTSECAIDPERLVAELPGSYYSAKSMEELDAKRLDEYRQMISGGRNALEVAREMLSHNIMLRDVAEIVGKTQDNLCHRIPKAERDALRRQGIERTATTSS
ncbi:hypothetical protein QCD60_30305 [Pokkaliibacter sp. MBI-7]|uniref:hypothetical protein n=1 Tax=Pokkaliibacter sp. MBI-7 TaxID=3040600 RepID=UPI00244C07D8|nr:hypothetical protein [Pokkaliibacter sp. MBI-7]MDH2431014.1 hypothetical protein [Pokkaliibacter sp. MBI-7]MDH2436709.1 hypothetical protein [Pokkaliibacter sp. MBI-7]MDH2436809.1 hypothetical protein [Pokkaliibacter sp. MBI-7]